MLCFIFTDVGLDRGSLRSEFSRCVESTLNRISVDGDQSTSDTAILFSSRARGRADRSEFGRALLEVLSGLADDIVRSGEGAGHVIKIRVKGLRDERTSVGVGKAIVNSPLVKTAIFGNDPNVGRIVSALGDFLGNGRISPDPSKVAVRMGGIEIFSNRAFRLDSRKETELSAYLTRTGFDPKVKGYPPHDECVVIEVILGGETPWTEVLGTDLSYEYVRQNADYRT
jgi:glutamate N-acetyltransferase/amino-acid N-acetyltransferase